MSTSFSYYLFFFFLSPPPPPLSSFMDDSLKDSGFKSEEVFHHPHSLFEMKRTLKKFPKKTNFFVCKLLDVGGWP